MKILLINPSSLEPENKRDYILGVPYLLSALRSNGYEDTQVKIFFNYSWSETEPLTVKLLKEYRPDVLLLSCFTINRVAGVKTAKIAKELNPDVKVVMGGMHPSFMYRQILTNYPVDAVCIGEGDETVVELMDAFREGKPLDGVKGLAFVKNGKVVETGRREFIKDLDTLAFPAHDIYRDYLIRERKAHVITSRGCPYGCQFCSTTEFWGRSWRARSPKSVVDEIEMLIREYNVNYVNFLDDEFTLQKKRTIELCKEIIDRGVKINWSCSTRVNTIDREQLEWMKKAGCDQIGMGIESGSPKILKTIGKKITVEQITKAFSMLQEFGFKRVQYLMVGNPGEDERSVKETIELVKQLRLEVPSVAVAELYPGTQLYDLAKSKGFITDDYWLSDDPPPFYTAETSAEKLQWWSFLIVLNSKMGLGAVATMRFLLWYVTTKSGKISRYAVRLCKNLTGMRKERYIYKRY